MEAAKLRPDAVRGVSKVLGHKVGPGAQPGSLEHVALRVEYSDGSTSGRGYDVPADTLRGTPALRNYVTGASGLKLAKYT